MEILVGLFGYLLFILSGVSIVRASIVSFGSNLNVSTALILPYLMICTFQVIVAFFYPTIIFPCLEYWLILIFFFSLTFITEYAVTRLFKIGKRKFRREVFSDITGKHVFYTLIILFLIYVVYDTYTQVSRVDITMLLQDEFEEEYGGSGGFYSRVFLMICATCFFGFFNKWYGFVLGVICLLPSLVVNTKGIIFIPILASLFLKAYLSEITNIKKTVLIVGAIGVFVFFGSYMWEFFTYGSNPLGDKDRWQQITDKLISYLISGVQEFNVNIVSPIDDVFRRSINITLTPFNNLLSKFGIGESISSINEISRPIGLKTTVESSPNVNSHIGTLYLFNGLVGASLLHMFWVSLTILIRKIASITKSIFMVVCYCLLLTGFALGWFDFYFMQTFWIYIIIFCLILSLFFTSKRKRNEL